MTSFISAEEMTSLVANNKVTSLLRVSTGASRSCEDDLRKTGETQYADLPKTSRLLSLSSTLSSCQCVRRLLLLLLASAVMTSLAVGVSVVKNQYGAPVIRREARANGYRGGVLVPQDTTASLSFVSRAQFEANQNDCYDSDFECQRIAKCFGPNSDVLCRCPLGYYRHYHQRHHLLQCQECNQTCPKGHYLLGACSPDTDPICVECTKCSRTQYEAVTCTSTSDTVCMDVTFPLQFLPTNATNCTDEKTPVRVSHSANVFLERLVSMKELETPMYVTNNQQTQDFVWHRESGIDIVVGISGVFLIPEYRELSSADDSQFFLTQSRETQRRLRLFAQTQKQYCRHPVPDYYYLHLEVIKNRTTAAQVVRCDSQDPTVPRCPPDYKDGDRFLKWDINKRCYKYNMYVSQAAGRGRGRQPMVVLRDGFNTVVCTDETSLDRELFRVLRPSTLEMMLPSTECGLARQQCGYCLSLSACHGIDKHKSCCGLSCFNKGACRKMHSPTCPPPEVECATGEVHRFTVIPVFSSMSEEWHCHLAYQPPSYLYNISYTVSIPDLKLQLPTQTYTAKSDSWEHHQRRAGHFHFIQVWHDIRLPLDTDIILQGHHEELASTNPKHMQPFVFRALKPPSEFTRGKGFKTVKQGETAYTTAVQFQKPFLYSSTSWYSDGCRKNVSGIFPNQTVYRDGDQGVKVTAKKTDKGGSFWYQVSDRQKSPYIKLSVPEGESLLRWFMGKTVRGTLDGDTLSALLSWDHARSLWTIRVTGQVKNCPAIFTLQIFKKMMTSCAGIYDIFVACPNNFTLTFNLSRTGDGDLPDIFVLMLNDSAASHQLVLTSVVPPLSLPVASLHNGYAADHRRGHRRMSQWSPMLAVLVLCLIGLGVASGVYFHIKCSPGRPEGNVGPHSQLQTENTPQDHQDKDKQSCDYQDANKPFDVQRDADKIFRFPQDVSENFCGRQDVNRKICDHLDAGDNFSVDQDAGKIFRDHQDTDKHFHDLHGSEANPLMCHLPDVDPEDHQPRDSVPENRLPAEIDPLNEPHDEQNDHLDAELAPRPEDYAETNLQNQKQKQKDVNQRNVGSGFYTQNGDLSDTKQPHKSRVTQKCLCVFVLLYILYSFVFTFSTTFSILYVTHYAITSGKVSGVADFSRELQKELNASFLKVQHHERREEVRLYRTVDSRLQACAFHLQRQNGDFLHQYQDHVTELLNRVYQQDGAVQTLAGMSLTQNSSLYAEEIQRFLVDCNRTVQSVLDRFEAFFLLHVKELSRNAWLDFAREVFLTQEGDPADRKYLSLDQLTRFLSWLPMDKVHELLGVSQAMPEGLAELKLPSPSEHLKHTVTSPFEALLSSLPSEPMVAAHTFLVLDPPPPSLSPTSGFPVASPASTAFHPPLPQSAFLYREKPSDHVKFQDIGHHNNGSHSQPLTSDSDEVLKEEEDEELGLWVYITIGLFLLMDVLLFIFRMSWMVNQLKAARGGYEDRIPTDPVCQKLLAIQTGYPLSRMQDIYQTHRYSRQNKENLTSEIRASQSELNVYLCHQTYPNKSKDDILRQIMEQKINGGKIGLGQERPPEMVKASSPQSPQHVTHSPPRAVREMGAFCCWLQRVLVSHLLWRFVVTTLLVVLLCVLMYTADFWLTADNLRVLVGGQSALQDLHLQVHMTNVHLSDVASHLAIVLEEHIDTVRGEMSMAAHLLSSTINTQRGLLVDLLERLCTGTATPMCDTLSNFSDLPLPQLPVWQPCNFMPPLPSLYRDISGENLELLVAQQLSPLLRTAKHSLSSMCAIVIAVLYLLFLCHAAATVARYYLLLWGHLPRVQIFQISENTSMMLDAEPDSHKPMQRSASWLESCESGVYVGENEADTNHPNRDV